MSSLQQNSPPHINIWNSHQSSAIFASWIHCKPITGAAHFKESGMVPEVPPLDMQHSSYTPAAFTMRRAGSVTKVFIIITFVRQTRPLEVKDKLYRYLNGQNPINLSLSSDLHWRASSNWWTLVWIRLLWMGHGAWSLKAGKGTEKKPLFPKKKKKKMNLINWPHTKE